MLERLLITDPTEEMCAQRYGLWNSRSPRVKAGLKAHKTSVGNM